VIVYERFKRSSKKTNEKDRMKKKKTKKGTLNEREKKKK
jgi:hypothetical protein